MSSFLKEQTGLGRVQDNLSLEARNRITSSWRSTSLLDGIKENSLMESNIATLYENTARHIVSEGTSTADGASGPYETIAFPLVRRIFTNLLANEIVTVYALNYPVGRLYFMKPIISARDVNFDHTSVQGGYSNQPAFNNDNSVNQVVPLSNKNLYDSF